MAQYSADSKMRDLFKSPQACEVLESYLPGLTTNKMSKMTFAFTFRKVAAFRQLKLPKEMVDEIDQKLRALG